MIYIPEGKEIYVAARAYRDALQLYLLRLAPVSGTA
jgi:hypothetical protein